MDLSWPVSDVKLTKGASSATGLRQVSAGDVKVSRASVCLPFVFVSFDIPDYRIQTGSLTPAGSIRPLSKAP